MCHHKNGGMDYQVMRRNSETLKYNNLMGTSGTGGESERIRWTGELGQPGNRTLFPSPGFRVKPGLSSLQLPLARRGPTTG